MAALLLGAVALQAGTVRAAGYRVAKDSEVSFLARITASSFIAKSTALDGTVSFDGAAQTIEAAVIKVKADSFETGMSLRDSHMRDNYLEAAKFPEIVFQLAGARVNPTPGSESAVEGVFVIKGVKKPTKVTIKVVENAGGKLAVTTTFKLNISDYGIPQPKFTMVKMEPVIDVTLKLVLEEEKP